MQFVKQKIQKFTPFDAWQRWEFKHTTVVIIGFLLFLLLLNTSIMTTVIDVIAAMHYVGVFLTGILFVSLFTAIPAFVLLFSFTDLNPIVVALVAGLGSMVGDYIILRFMEDKVAYELKPIAAHFGIPQTIAYLQGQKSTLGLVRIMGALVIASPLPDEIGIGLLGLGKLKPAYFLLVCYVLNVFGLLLILEAAQLL